MDRRSRTARGTRAADHLIVVGVVLYLVAWFVPAWRGQEVLGPLGPLFGDLLAPGMAVLVEPVGPDWLPGLQAVEVAWELLAGGGQDDSWRRRVVGSTCFSNLVMLAAMFVLLARHRSSALGLAMLGCAVWNASWLYLGGERRFDLYGIGYYLWLGSFVLVGLGMAARSEE